MPGLKANKKTGDSAGFRWETPPWGTNTLFYNGENVAEIKLVANLSRTNRISRKAYVFGRFFRDFEHVGPARTAVTERVKEELARANEDTRSSGESRSS